MNSETIVYCVVALLLGMLLANMLKNVCGCNNIVEGTDEDEYVPCNELPGDQCRCEMDMGPVSCSDRKQCEKMGSCLVDP